MKKLLGDKRFGSNDEVITVTEACFNDFQILYFLDGLLKLDVGWINVSVSQSVKKYVEKQMHIYNYHYY